MTTEKKKRSHEDIRQEIEAYRHVARTVFGQYDKKFGEVKIPEHGSIHFVEGGAFVEATLFIPEEWVYPVQKDDNKD